MAQFLRSAIQLMRIERPVGTVLLVAPMLWALWLAGMGQPPADYVLIFMLGAFVMRSAGCVINDFADRKIDLKVKRTKDRPLTSGRIGSKETLFLFALLVACAMLLLAFLPRTAIYPAVLAFVLATLYPFTKRFFIIPQLVLGLAYSSSVLMAYVVILGKVPLLGWLLFLASTLWTIIYDTFYAMVDRDDDESLAVYSSALWFGKHDLHIQFFLMLVFLLLMLCIGVFYQLTIYYYVGLIFAASCFGYQLWVSQSRKREQCFIAFLNNQWVGVFIFLGILIAYLP